VNERAVDEHLDVGRVDQQALGDEAEQRLPVTVTVCCRLTSLVGFAQQVSTGAAAHCR